MNKTPREKAHHSIRHVFSGALAEYYKKNPDKLLNTTQVEVATDFMMKIMLEVLQIVDEFDRTCTGEGKRRQSDQENP